MSDKPSGLNLKALSDPFSPASIHWRVGATNGDKTTGIALAYLDARDVIDRLDFVCSPENWQTRYPFEGCCEIGIKIEGGWVWKANGAGKTKVEGDKGQYSDAFKRAAVLWGIGRYLYDLPNQWYELRPRGKSYIFTKEAIGQMQKHLNDWQKVLVPKNIRMEVAEQTRACLKTGDAHGIKEIWQEFGPDEQSSLWPEFDSAERGLIKKLFE